MSATLTRGDVFGSLTVVEVVGVGPRGRIWLCTCACGGETRQTAQALRRSPHARCEACRQVCSRTFKPPRTRKAPVPPPSPIACQPLSSEIFCCLVEDLVAWRRDNRPPGGLPPAMVRPAELPTARDFRAFPSWWLHRHAGGMCRDTVDRHWHPEGGGCISRPRARQRGDVRALFPASAQKLTEGMGRKYGS